MMRVGFDAKRIFHNSTGLGNYGRDVIRILNTYTEIEKYVLYNTKPPRINRLNPDDTIFIKYPKNWFWKKMTSLWRLSVMSKQIISDNLDIYHGLSGEIPLGLRKGKIKTVVTIHDLIFLTHPQYYSFFDRIIYREKFKHAARNADIIIAISVQTKLDIIKHLDIEPRKIKVIYQGCSEVFKQDYNMELRSGVRKKYNLPDQFILNVGTLQERKNALAIVKAVKGTKHTVVLVGSKKKYANEISHFIEKHKMQGQILFLKNVDEQELAIIYQLATVFCYPSICEGFGIPLIEALFSRTPVITSKGGCFAEAAGPDSIYISPDNIQEIRSHLNDLMQNPEKRNQIAEKGHHYVQRFNDQIVAKNIYSVYKSLLE